MNGLKELARVISEVELPKLTRRVRPHGFPKVDMSKYVDDERDDEREEDDIYDDEGLRNFSHIPHDLYSVFVDISLGMENLNLIRGKTDSHDFDLIKSYDNIRRLLVNEFNDLYPGYVVSIFKVDKGRTNIVVSFRYSESLSSSDRKLIGSIKRYVQDNSWYILTDIIRQGKFWVRNV